MIRTVHPFCTPECRHAPTTSGGRYVQMPESKGVRADLEPAVLELAAGEPVTYLGVQGPTRGGDDPWPVHTWRIGRAEPRRILAQPAAEDTERPTREIKADYRREVWTGSGEKVQELSFARVHEIIAEPFPMPEVTSADPQGSVIVPPPAVDLAAYAAGLGWEHMITYARGWVPHATHGRPLKDIRESWAVRLRREHRRAVAVRMGGDWASMWTWGQGEQFTHRKGITAFREAIR